MRWLIGLLVVLNFILALWLGVGGNAVVNKSASPAPDVGQLRLLSELGVSPPPEKVAEEVPPVAEQEHPESLESPAEEPVVHQSVVQEPALEEEPSILDSGLTVAPPAPGQDESMVNEKPPGPAHAEAEAPAPVEAVPEKKPVPEPSVPPKVAMEAAPAAAPEKTVKEPVPSGPEPTSKPTPEPAPAVKRVCWQLGPFEDEAQAMSLVPELPVGIEVLKTSKMQIRLPNGYYVLIPAFQERSKAREVVRQLKDKGIKDSWIFVSGPLKNAISLGMFSREENAKRRHKSVASKGFESELYPRYRRQERVALLVTGTPGGAAERSLKRLSANLLETIPCP